MSDSDLIVSMTIIPVAIGVVLASLLFDYIRDQFGERLSNLFRAGFYLPQILPITTAGVLWGWILSPLGVANIVLKAIGLAPLAQNWIGDATWALPSVSLMIVWIQVGYCLVVFMAGLSRIDPSLYEAALALSAWEATEYWYTGQIPRRLGTAHRLNAPYQAFRASDGHFTVGAANEKLWPMFAKLLGLEHLTADPRFKGVGNRVKNRAALEAELEKVTSTETRAHWLAKCEAAGIPAGPIYTVPEAHADAHAQSRRMVETLEHPQAGRVKTLGNPVKLSRSPAVLRSAAPVLGADTDAVLAGLGYSAGDIAGLRARKVLGEAQPKASR